MASIMSAADRMTQSLGSNPSLMGVIGSLRSASVAVPTVTSGLASNPAYIGQRAEFKYYTLPGGTRGDRSILAHYVALKGFKEIHSRAVGPAILTMIELVYPGMLSTYDPGMSGIVMTKLVFPVELTNILLQDDMPTVQVENEDGAATTEAAIHPDVEGFLEDLTYDQEISRGGNNFYESIFLLGMLIYTIGKDPGELNIAAFTTNRLEMFRSITGVPAQTDTLLTPTRLPGVEELKKVKGFFNLHVRFRKVFVRELARWDVQTSCTDDQEAILGFVRLWKMSGMTHIFMVGSFINNYRAVLAGIPGLRTEVEKFIIEYSTWQRQEKTYLSPYARVIDGGRSAWLRSRDFPELLKLSRWVSALENPRMQRYAARSGRSFYQELFIQLAAEYGIDLTAEVAPIADDS